MALNILILDDSEMMRKRIARALRQSGLDTSVAAEAENGIKGLEALTSQSVDLVLCDWNMPEMDGLQFIKEARKEFKTPIVMLTTESSQERIMEAMEAGADGYVTKPFTPEKLAMKLSLILGI